MRQMQKSDGIVIEVQELSILSYEGENKTKPHQNENEGIATTMHDGPTH